MSINSRTYLVVCSRTIDRPRLRGTEGMSNAHKGARYISQRARRRIVHGTWEKLSSSRGVVIVNIPVVKDVNEQKHVTEHETYFDILGGGGLWALQKRTR